jgi:hypothetical protein
MLHTLQCYADPNRSIMSSWDMTSSQCFWLNKFASTGEQGSAYTQSFKAHNSTLHHYHKFRKRRNVEYEVLFDKASFSL